MRILATFLILTIAATFAWAAGTEKIQVPPYDKYILPNGLNVILQVDHSNPIAAVYVVYHVGSAREVPGKTGFAHLFEHLRFNESQDIPQGMWFKKLQTAGASNINGSTGNDRTNYFEVIPSNAVELALWMESDRMGFLLSKFTPKTFHTQQNVVQNEKRQGENSPYSQTSYINDKLMYPEGHPYSWQVIGSMEDLANASIQDAINFHNKYYGPSNATLVICGDIDPAQVKEWVEKYFAEIPSSPKPPALPPMPVTLKESKRAYYEDNLASAPQLTMTFATVQDDDKNKDSYALPYLARILAGSKKSPFYKVIVEEKKLAPDVSVRANSGELAGTLDITIRAFPNVKLGDVESAIHEAFARFEKEGFSEQDVDRQKPRREFMFFSSLSSVLGKARMLSDYNMFNGSPDYMITNFNNTVAVNKNDVMRVYDTYVKGKPSVLLSIVPKGKTDLVAPNSTVFVVPEESIESQGTKLKDNSDTKLPPIPSKIDRTKEPALGPDPEVKIPAIWTAKTSNGITLYGIDHSVLPIAQFSVILKGGMILDPQGKSGTAYLTAQLLNEGTKTKTPIELREAIEDLGASISISATDEATVVNASCLADKFPQTFSLVKEMLLEPRFDEKEFGLLKNQTVYSLKRQESQPTSIASNVFDKLVYGSDCILAHQPMGTVQSIGEITINDLKQYYDQNYSASVGSITIVGAVPEPEAVKVFNGLDSWKTTTVNFPVVKFEGAAKPGVYFVDVPKARQSVVNAGHIGPRTADPDFYKAVVMNHYLGGDFSAILNMILRETKSFTYGARSGFSGGSYTGEFKASTSVQSNATHETVQIIRDEIAKYRDGINPQTLDEVKSTLLKSNTGRFETLMQLTSMLYPIVLYNLPFDYVKQREAIVRSMTPAEEKALAQKYLLPDKMIYLVVGDKATQFDKLKDLGLGDPILLDRDAVKVVQ